jgi:hypothetical protein
MAEKCDGQLKGMVQDLKEVIDYLNSTNANQQQEDNPVCSLQHSRGCGGGGVWWGWEVIPSFKKCSTFLRVNFKFSNHLQSNLNRPIAHDVTAPVTMYLEDKLAIYS